MQSVGREGRVLGLEPFAEAHKAAEANVASHTQWCEERSIEVGRVYPDVGVGVGVGMGEDVSVGVDGCG